MPSWLTQGCWLLLLWSTKTWAWETDFDPLFSTPRTSLCLLLCIFLSLSLYFLFSFGFSSHRRILSGRGKDTMSQKHNWSVLETSAFQKMPSLSLSLNIFRFYVRRFIICNPKLGANLDISDTFWAPSTSVSVDPSIIYVHNYVHHLYTLCTLAAKIHPLRSLFRQSNHLTFQCATWNLPYTFRDRYCIWSMVQLFTVGVAEIGLLAKCVHANWGDVSKAEVR